nr:Chain C, A89NLS [synthetic construct]4B8P_D Chain D, A89NLS [synthetic construct]4BA3_B Chain B, A89NLS [synthetic construct]
VHKTVLGKRKYW